MSKHLERAVELGVEAQFHAALKWTDEMARTAQGKPCQLCALTRVRNSADTLAVVVGFGADGGGQATLLAVCATCARGHNVVARQAVGAVEL
jgi:hypothetical protein